MNDGTNTSVIRPPSALDQVIREGARQLLQRALELEVAEVIAQFEGLRDEQGRHRIVRNGELPERTVLTGAGPLKVRQPRVRDRAGKDAPDRVQFRSTLLPPYLRRSPTVETLMPWLYLKGVSMGDMSDALVPLLGEVATGLSARVVGQLKDEWAHELTTWRKRDLSQKKYVYLWADGVVRHEALLDRVG